MLLECETRTIALFERNFLSVGAVLAPPSTGTCFVWDDYTLLTCLHVVQNSSNQTITLSSGTSLTSFISHRCPAHDIAVLHTSTRLPTPLRRSPVPARPGQLTFALAGYADTPPCLTAGVVSAVGRSAPAPKEGGPMLTGLLQVDACVNNGASGAPLLDSEGRVVGMVCAIASESGRFEGVAYAVPIVELEKVASNRRARM